jgi:hypothetical protein
MMSSGRRKIDLYTHLAFNLRTANSKYWGGIVQASANRAKVIGPAPVLYSAPSYCCFSAVEAVFDADTDSDSPQALITASFCDKTLQNISRLSV